jgi:uncharacterized protein YggL (DUF469 family)
VLARSEWLSIAAYGRCYSADRKTVRKWLEGGLLITFRVGRVIRIKNQPPIVQKSENYAFRKQ